MDNKSKTPVATIETQNGLKAYLDYAIKDNKGLVHASIFDGAATKLNAVSAYAAGEGTRTLITATMDGVQNINCPYEYRVITNKVTSAHSYYVNNIITAKNNDSLITAEGDICDTLYNYLMNRFNLPIKRDHSWLTYILEAMEDREYADIRRGSQCVITDNPMREISLAGKKIMLKDIVVLSISIKEEELKYILSEGATSGRLRFSESGVPAKPLQVESMDDYMKRFADSIVANTSRHFTPLTDYRGAVDGLALKNKKLFPQQAMVVNAMKELIRKNEKYGFIIAEMGTGKTIMGESVVESYFVEKAMRRHHLSVSEVYKNPELVNYRAIILAPGHLVKTWATDIEKEIPYAKVTIIKNLEQLIQLRENGKKRNGREFYIMSKDVAKLGASIAPTPTKVKESVDLEFAVCGDCAKEHNLVLKRYGQEKCSVCNGKHWEKRIIGSAGKVRAMVCPHCSSLLINGGKKLELSIPEEDAQKYVLEPGDFRAHYSWNDECYHCGSKLWGIDANNIIAENEFAKMARREPKWIKVKEWKGYSKKGECTAFALKGYEDEAYRNRELANGLSVYKKSRKYAPAQYIKKYLKGYFDVCVLDEVHKFEGAGTAQAQAADAISKASKFTIGLTGTLTNGTAMSLFYLLYMLDPVRMSAKGYEYSDALEFVRNYGTIETAYETNSTDEEYRKNGRGRQISQPKVKPGISPLIYSEFLLDKAVFLSITDFSNFLPKFTENVITVEEDSEVMSAYRDTIGQLKSQLRSPEGGAARTGLLQAGLSYTDKPYGRKPIMATKIKDFALASYEDLRQYEEGQLLKKEEELIKLVSKEISEDRNCFIYAVYTGQAESNVTGRLKNVIEEHCNLKGAVQILEASSPNAAQRADWIHQKASEGVRVFICNPSLVETGLDFKFEYEGRVYNYPTIIFYQTDYKLATFWQAGRRAYRLNQTEECRNYYLATNGTAQVMALKVMAEKQMSASALQGNFSAEGLAAMSNGMDAQAQLTKMLIEGSEDDSMDLASKFDVLNQSKDTDNLDNEVLEEYKSVKNFYELTGLNSDDTFDEVPAEEMFTDIPLFGLLPDDVIAPAKAETPIIYQEKEKVPEETKADGNKLPYVDLSLFFGSSVNGGFGAFESVESNSNDLFGNFNFSNDFGFTTATPDDTISAVSEVKNEEIKSQAKSTKKKVKNKSELAKLMENAQMTFCFE